MKIGRAFGKEACSLMEKLFLFGLPSLLIFFPIGNESKVDTQVTNNVFTFDVPLITGLSHCSSCLGLGMLQRNGTYWSNGDAFYITGMAFKFIVSKMLRYSCSMTVSFSSVFFETLSLCQYLGNLKESATVSRACENSR